MIERLTSFPRPDEGAHPSRHRWDGYLAEILEPQERAELEAHLEDCSHCQETVAFLKEERASFLAQANAADFMAQLLDASQKMPPSREGFFEKLSAFWRPYIWGPMAAVACGVLLFLAIPKNSIDTPPERFTKRKSPKSKKKVIAPVKKKAVKRSHMGATRKNSAFLDVQVWRDGSWSAKPQKIKTFKEGDRLGLRYVSGPYRYMTMILIDQKGSVSWLYPKEAGDSMPIAARGQLKDDIELDDAKGQEKLYTFFSTEPIKAQDIQKLLKGDLSKSVLSLSQAPKNKIYLHTFTIQKQ